MSQINSEFVLDGLLFDNWMQPVSGLRGPAGPRQLAMSAGEFDLHVGVHYNHNGRNIRGQLLKRDERTFVSKFDVLLLDACNAALESVVADEFGEFLFLHGPTEATAIAIQLEDGRIIKCQLPKEEDQ